jgi:hypothetical protein
MAEKTTFFDKIRKNFTDVPLTDSQGISVTEFLEAAESLVSLFGTYCVAQTSAPAL